MAERDGHTSSTGSMERASVMATGLYFEDFSVGDVFLTRSRTITETDIVLFTGLSWDTHPWHTDDEFCEKNTPFGRKIAQGGLGLAAATGLVSLLGHLEDTAVGFLGMQWKFTGPIKEGDTITAKVTVKEKIETSNPSRGVLVREISVLNQHEEQVQKGEMSVLVLRKPASSR